VTWLGPAIGATTAVLATLVAFLVYRVQAAALRATLGDREATNRAEVTAAHTAAQTALATSAQQLASGAYMLADQLRQELERHRAQAAQDAIAAAQVIADLRQQIGAMQTEIDALRAVTHHTTGS
jgi:hypothetical protein